MKILKLLLLLAGFIAVGSGQAAAGDLKIIANKDVRADTISATELRSVFLEETIRFAGMPVEPVLEGSGPVHEAFIKEYLGKDDETLQTYYRTLVFSGKGFMPKILGSDAAVIAYVARSKGTIGYVSATSNTEGVKTLVVTSVKNPGERSLITRVEPEYPEVLRRLQIGGTVRLALTISAKGSVEEVRLLGGNPILGERAIAAVKQWVYAPSHSRTITEISIPFAPER
jgi:TonB family protein